MRRECLRKTAEEKCECNGNTRCCIYEITDSVPSFDKGGHKERSLVEQPNHRIHWKKEERKRINIPLTP